MLHPLRIPMMATLLGLGLSVSTALGEEAPPPEPEQAMKALADATERVKELGPWEDEYAHIASALQNVWSQNGWTDESDLYARDLALDVSRIPPWEFTKRLELVSQRVSQRYSLAPGDVQRWQGMATREVFGFMLRHAPVIAKQAQEMVDTRARKQPFTAEQIARWTRDTEPLLADVRERVDKVSKEMREGLTPDQQAIFDRDFASFTKRFQHYQEQRKHWAQGRWKADDWGMQNDPIQSGSAAAPSDAAAIAPTPAAGAPPGAAPVAVVPTKWIPHDPTTWVAYVLATGQKLGFDQAQRNSAATIHEELLLRADKYMAKRKDALAAVDPSARAADPLYQPLCALFDELVRRVDALATTAQRDQSPR
jgi:hypothetical protein